VIRDADSEVGLGEIIAEGAYYGMQTFDQALFEHVQAGRVRVEDALLASTSPHDFKLLLEAQGPKNSEAQLTGEASKPLSLVS
jgi:twitching motility protein PilT